ncbi:hypothetical protein O3S80_40370, partial [Streptomyces sp. Lzd4kr]|nr:hypothetical protein [Streptomyces sp. Lzd4kr]
SRGTRRPPGTTAGPSACPQAQMSALNERKGSVSKLTDPHARSRLGEKVKNPLVRGGAILLALVGLGGMSGNAYADDWTPRRPAYVDADASHLCNDVVMSVQILAPDSNYTLISAKNYGPLSATLLTVGQSYWNGNNKVGGEWIFNGAKAIPKAGATNNELKIGKTYPWPIPANFTELRIRFIYKVKNDYVDVNCYATATFSHE